MSATQTRERIIGIIATGDSFGAAANIAGEIDVKDKRIAELEGLLRESVATMQDDITKNNALKAAGDALVTGLSEARSNLRLAEIRINGFIGAQEDAAAEVAKLKPYAFVQIAKLKRDSAIEELNGAEDEEERRQCARDLGDWHEMVFRATNLMREQWERDRKTMVRVELGDMVKAACS